MYHSVECSLSLTDVVDPVTNPVKTECELTVSSVDTLCKAPQNPNVLADPAATHTTVLSGSVAMRTVRSKQQQIKKGDITGKGKATVNINAVSTCPASPAPDDPCLLDLKSSVCANPDWQLVDIIVRAVAVVYRAYQCGDDACRAKNLVLASTAEYNCVLPVAVDFATYSKKSIFYDCTLISSTHVR